jgi:hypothetical protein
VYAYWKEENSVVIVYPPFDKEANTNGSIP